MEQVVAGIVCISSSLCGREVCRCNVCFSNVVTAELKLQCFLLTTGTTDSDRLGTVENVNRFSERFLGSWQGLW